MHVLLLKIIISLGIGFFLNRIYGSDKNRIIGFLINIVWFIVIPLFILVYIWQADFAGSDAVLTAGAALFVVFAGIITVRIISLINGKVVFRETVLPVSFMNSGYLGLAINQFLWGDTGAALGVVYNTAVAIMIYTIGIYLVSGKRELRSIIKVPVIYAMAAGIILKFSGIGIGGSLLPYIDMIKKVSPVLMLILVGYKLKFVNFHSIRLILFASAVRLIGGLAAAAVFITLFSTPSSVSRVILTASCLPSAVTSYILTEKYNAGAETCAGIVTASTLIYMIILTLAMIFIL